MPNLAHEFAKLRRRHPQAVRIGWMLLQFGVVAGVIVVVCEWVVR